MVDSSRKENILKQIEKSKGFAVLTFMWFKVSDKDKPFAQMILDHARVGEVAEDFYGKVSDYINKGNKIQAIKLMENQLKAKAENKWNVRESTAISMVKMINELEAKMAEGEKKFWPISGRWSKWYSKWLWWKETQTINSEISRFRCHRGHWLHHSASQWSLLEYTLRCDLQSRS